jgi:hypothetical protein
MVYAFDQYVDGKQMGVGACIQHASNEAEALKKARELFEPDANPGEMERTTFVLRTNE